MSICGLVRGKREREREERELEALEVLEKLPTTAANFRFDDRHFRLRTKKDYK
jgi:hypothetical protein